MKKPCSTGVIARRKSEVNGEKGYHGFLGLKDLMLVYDELEDGAELEWYEMEPTKAQAKELTRQKELLHAFNPTNFED